ncbi:MAG TPA: hypothetical protein VLV83_01830 [Acidobacteriota bacterium]|nr:hypothetical protein [Acidobacteriota bacterium]
MKNFALRFYNAAMDSAQRLSDAIRRASDEDVEKIAERPHVKRFAGKVMAALHPRGPNPAAREHGKKGGRPAKPVYFRGMAYPSTPKAAKEMGITSSRAYQLLAAREDAFPLEEGRYRFMGEEVSWDRLVKEAGGQDGAIAVVNDGRAEVVR